MKLIKIVEQKRFLDIQVNPIVTESIERNVLKKKGKMSLRMRQMDTTNFIQGELIDIRDERRANRKDEKRAKKRNY